MLYLEITTVGEVAFSHSMKLEEGYRYDIPFDETSLPYIPVADLLKKEGLLPEGTEPGFAHPKGYLGIVKSADMLLRSRPDSARFIRACFTNDRFLKYEDFRKKSLPDGNPITASRFLQNEGFRVRSLKAGQKFRATLILPNDRAEQAKNALENISHLGIRTEEITGEVIFKVIDEDPEPINETGLRSLCDYTALEYSATLFAPTCFHVPYADELTTKLYMPGEVMRQYLQSHMVPHDNIVWDSLRFGNAYIAQKGKRLLPVPASMAVIKLDKQALRYRFAAERDPRLVEQVTGLDGAFTTDLSSRLVRYTTPSTEHINAGKGELLDALSAGQTFRGFIYGKNDDLRCITKWMEKNPIFHVGKLSDAGFGEVFCKTERLLEQEIPAEMLSRRFDVLCVSDVLLLNDRGMNVYKAEDLLQELEYKLGISGKLRVTGRYRYSENDTLVLDMYRIGMIV